MGTEKRERQKANRALKHQQEMQATARRRLYRNIAIGVVGIAAIVVFVWIASTIVGSDDAPPTPATLPETVPETVADTEPPSTVEDTSPATTTG